MLDDVSLYPSSQWESRMEFGGMLGNNPANVMIPNAIRAVPIPCCLSESSIRSVLPSQQSSTGSTRNRQSRRPFSRSAECHHHHHQSTLIHAAISASSLRRSKSFDDVQSAFRVVHHHRNDDPSHHCQWQSSELAEDAFDQQNPGTFPTRPTSTSHYRS